MRAKAGPVLRRIGFPFAGVLLMAIVGVFTLGLHVVSQQSSVPGVSAAAAVSGRRVVSQPPSATPFTPETWPRRDDPDFQFSVSYPPNFSLQRQHGIPGTGLVMAYRAVDNTYLAAYPPGQIEIAIYLKDADSLSMWVARHSGPPSSSSANRYWDAATNQGAVRVDGRDGLTFDWRPDTGQATIHATAVFLRATYVLVLQWWSTDPAYAATVQQYHKRMVADLRS
jgi:hypothetical protein